MFRFPPQMDQANQYCALLYVLSEARKDATATPATREIADIVLSCALNQPPTANATRVLTEGIAYARQWRCAMPKMSDDGRTEYPEEDAFILYCRDGIHELNSSVMQLGLFAQREQYRKIKIDEV